MGCCFTVWGEGLLSSHMFVLCHQNENMEEDNNFELNNVHLIIILCILYICSLKTTTGSVFKDETTFRYESQLDCWGLPLLKELTGASAPTTPIPTPML